MADILTMDVLMQQGVQLGEAVSLVGWMKKPELGKRAGTDCVDAPRPRKAAKKVQGKTWAWCHGDSYVQSHGHTCGDSYAQSHEPTDPACHAMCCSNQGQPHLVRLMQLTGGSVHVHV
jgi:hypothetical protein